MSSKYIFVKRNTTLRKRLLTAILTLVLAALLIIILNLEGKDSDLNTSSSPIEPTGTRLVTNETVEIKQPISTGLSSITQATLTGNEVQSPSALTASVQVTQVNEDAALREAVNQWKNAWSQKNVSRYLSFYGPEYVPSTGISRQAWESSRYERILSKQKISIDIQNLEIQVNNNTATVKFTQRYSDERLRMSDRKMQKWQKLNGRWVILHETTN